MSQLDVILDKRSEQAERERKVYRQTSPRASSIGDCPREIYHSIVDWDQRPPPGVELLHRFRRGNEVESLVIQQLLKLGFEVIGSQVQFEIKENIEECGGDTVICSGHIDGQLVLPDGSRPVFDVKSLNPNVWNRINSAQDFIRMGSFWSKYPRQLLLYMYQYSEPVGFFLLDDCCGHWKIIEMNLLEWIDECEEALQIATTAAVGVGTKTPPPYHADPVVCRRCWCLEAAVCHPPLDFSGDAMNVIEDPEFETDIARADQLKDNALEFAALDKKVKEKMKARGDGNYVAGDYSLSVESKPRAGYNVPQKVKDQYKIPNSAVYIKWSKMKDDGKDG